MATNPLITLEAGRTADITPGLSLLGEGIDRRRERKRQERLDPLRERLLQAQASQVEQQNQALVDARMAQFNKARLGVLEQLRQIEDEDQRQVTAAQAEQEFIDAGFGDFVDGEPDNVSLDAIDAALPALQAIVDGTAVGKKYQYQSLGRVKAGDDVYSVTERRDPDNGATDILYNPVTPGAPAVPQGPIEQLSPSTGLTSAEQQKRDIAIAREKSEVAVNARRAEEMQAESAAIKSELRQLREIQSLLKGQQGEVPRTGPVWRLLPNMSSSAINLQNRANRLGLAVIAGGKFGPLSEKEMEFATDTALPDNLEAPDLLIWVEDRLDAQEKLSQTLDRAAEMLFDGMRPTEIDAVFAAEAAEREAKERKVAEANNISEEVWRELSPRQKKLWLNP